MSNTDISFKSTMLLAIQATSSAAIAVYAYKTSAHHIWPIMSSLVAAEGIYSLFTKLQRKYQRSTDEERENIWSACNIATGTVTYGTFVFAFSKSLKLNDRLWIPCLGFAATGYYFAASSIRKLDTFFEQKIYLKCLQLLFEPALIACTSIYLLYFRNHEEGWLYWIPFIVTGAAGFETATRGCDRVETIIRKTLLLKFIEMMMGSCLLTISSFVLTIYFLVNDFHTVWAILMMIVNLFGTFLIYGALTCLRRYIFMNWRVFYAVVGMVSGPLSFVSAVLFYLCVDDTTMAQLTFYSFTGIGHFLLCRSTYELCRIVPRPIFRRYSKRIFGPIMTMYSSMAATYYGYNKEWFNCLLGMNLASIGVYVTYRGLY